MWVCPAKTPCWSTQATVFYELLDLKIARCTLMTAALAGAPSKAGRIRVATKYVNLAKRYYAAQGRQVDIIKLYGAMELAPCWAWPMKLSI